MGNTSDFPDGIDELNPRQIVSVIGNPKAVSGEIISLSISYDVSDNDPNLNGLGLQVHYDSSALSFVDFMDVLMVDNVGMSGANNDVEDLDNDPSTDKYLSVYWASVGVIGRVFYHHRS